MSQVDSFFDKEPESVFPQDSAPPQPDFEESVDKVIVWTCSAIGAAGSKISQFPHQRTLTADFLFKNSESFQDKHVLIDKQNCSCKSL